MQEMVGKYKANFYTLQGLTLESKKRWDSIQLYCADVSVRHVFSQCHLANVLWIDKTWTHS